MELSFEVLHGNPGATVLHVAGRVDGSNYLTLIEKARESIASGTNLLIMNLEACDFLSSAGLFALHNIALMAHKYEPLDHEDGWGAMKIIANESREFKDRFKIVNVPPKIMRTFTTAGLSSIYGIYSDVQAALTAYVPIE
jgi:anti-anti-sigma regulatory factor